MELIAYDKNFVPYPFGLTNSGAICWFNSLLQSLLSCSSLNKTIIENQHQTKFASNEILKHYLKLLQYGLDNDKPRQVFLDQDHVQIINIIIKKQEKSKFKRKLGSGNQDADEGFKLVIDAIKNKSITQLFQLRYRGFITCNLCKHTHESTPNMGDLNITIDIAMDIFDGKPADKHAEIIQKYIIYHDEYLDDNYTCIKCKLKGNKLKYAKLTMLPEMLVLLFKKYTSAGGSVRAIKQNITFPQSLSFSRGKKKYQLISQCEHSGSLGGGHYWAISSRKNGTFNLNDSGTSITNFSPSIGTYLVFYHYVE